MLLTTTIFYFSSIFIGCFVHDWISHFVCFDLITTVSEVKLATNVFSFLPVAGPILYVDESTLKLVYNYSFARQRLMLRNISA